MKRCFISHCSEDITFLNRLEGVFLSRYDQSRHRFYYTSGTNETTLFGDKTGPALRSALHDSDVMIAVITDSYLRSVICIAEISTFWYLKKPVIPIVFNQDGIDFLKVLMEEDIIYVDLSDRRPEHVKNCANKMIKTLANYGYIPDDPSLAEQELSGLFSDGEQAVPRRAYIGSGQNYANIDQYCEKYGISRLKNTSLPIADLVARIKDCKELFIVATTGANLINALSSEFLPSALAGGMKLTVLIPNRWSAYISDVAEIESPDTAEEHKARFVREFDSVVYNLKYCLDQAKAISTDSYGEIRLGCAGTSIRQTVLLAVWEDRFWGWLSMTIPPKRTVDGTPSLEFSGSAEKASFGKLIYDHVQAIRDLAVRKNAFIDLSQNADFHEFYLENEGAEKYWKALYETAKQNSFMREGETELIEVAAQHPLRPDGRPGKEFARRLDCGIELYRQLQKEGRDVKFYIPGSVHCQDPCSLSESGRAYLASKGIPEDIILGEEENLRYKGDLGVYNTADECFVASRIFLEGDYRRLHCICSPNQILRKKLFYIAFGVIPFYYTVNTESMAHDDIYELFHSLPNIIMKDQTWQGSDSDEGNRTRKERNPRLWEKGGRNRM